MPAWYLRNGTINATENQLESASSSCERWGIWCGALVVAAVIAELVIAWIEPPYNTFLVDSAIADAAIALGIVGEVAFGMRDGRIQTELRKRSNEKLGAAEKAASEAGQRAAEASLELARIKAPRSFSAEAVDRIVAKLLAFSGTQFDIGTIQGDPEVFRFQDQLEAALARAGWKQVHWVVPEGNIVLTRAGKPATGFVTASDVTVGAYPEKAGTLGRAAIVFAEALNAEGVVARAEFVGEAFSNKNRDVVHIVIGRKT